MRVTRRVDVDMQTCCPRTTIPSFRTISRSAFLCSSNFQFSPSIFLSLRHGTFCMNEHLGRLAWEAKKHRQLRPKQRNSINLMAIKKSSEGSPLLHYEETKDAKVWCDFPNISEHCVPFEMHKANSKREHKQLSLISVRNSSFNNSYFKGAVLRVMDSIVVFATIGLMMYTFIFIVGFTLIKFYGY